MFPAQFRRQAVLVDYGDIGLRKQSSSGLYILIC